MFPFAWTIDYFLPAPLLYRLGVMFRVVMVCMDLIAVVFLPNFVASSLFVCEPCIAEPARLLLILRLFLFSIFLFFLLFLLFFAVLLKPCFSRLMTPAWTCAQ